MITSFRTYIRVTDVVQNSENEVENSKIAFFGPKKHIFNKKYGCFGGSSDVNVMVESSIGKKSLA